MNEYKYIIKAEYPDGPSYTEELHTLNEIHTWIGAILPSDEELPRITVKPVAPDVYTLD